MSPYLVYSCLTLLRVQWTVRITRQILISNAARLEPGFLGVQTCALPIGPPPQFNSLSVTMSR